MKKRMPFPSDAKNALSKSLANDSLEPPWRRAERHDQPLMFFHIERLNGNVVSYSYCDLRELRLHSPALLQLCIMGMEKYLVTISGRHLTDLADQISMAKIKSIVEVGPGTFELPEGGPSIDKITIEELTGPSGF